MRFGSVYTAVWLWIIPLFFVFYRLTEKARERNLRRVASEEVLKEISSSFDPVKRRTKKYLLLLSVLLMLIALMRPQWGFKWQEVKRRGLDLLIALDTSKSMLAEDVLPNRLDRARLAVKDLVKKLNGDRIGLIIFSGKAFLQCPLTVDYDGFLLSLDDVDVDSVQIGGTALSSAIYTAIKSYEGGEGKHKILVIITDGEDLEGGIEEALGAAEKEGIDIYCVGIGDPAGELIPITDEKGKRAFLKDIDGNVVKTRLVEGLLQKIAMDTGGMYVRSTGAEFGLDLIYEEKLSKLEKQDFESKMEKRYNERYQIPLGAALILLMIEMLLGDRKKRF
ncbi:MAG: VWA domain-containing protein [Candidatus Omnitrophota bacterium]|nr:VWA domain-containing protein [Candidatus Omnitrophota bacterium]